MKKIEVVRLDKIQAESNKIVIGYKFISIEEKDKFLKFVKEIYYKYGLQVKSGEITKKEAVDGAMLEIEALKIVFEADKRMEN